MLSLYDTFRKKRIFVSETEFVKKYTCTFNGEAYTVILTKRTATKNTVIHCIDDYIAWEQVPTIPRLAGKWEGEITPIYRVNANPLNTVFVIKGRPGTIIGLDEGIFHSANRFVSDRINVMSIQRFKKL